MPAPNQKANLTSFHRANEIIAQARQKTDTVLVAYSGGKDSKVVLDLCWRSFPNVVAFHSFFVPNLRQIDEQMDEARARYPGLKILMYPGHALFNAIKRGTYCLSHYSLDGMPEIKNRQFTYDWIRHDTGIELIATGQRKADSASRKRGFSWNKKSGQDRDYLHPLADWSKWDVFAYLGLNKIPIPPSCGDATGVCLSTQFILWCHDNYPDDYERLTRWFPDVEAVVARRAMYDIGGYYALSGQITKEAYENRQRLTSSPESDDAERQPRREEEVEEEGEAAARNP